MIKFDVLTLFPNMFDGFLSESIIKRAIEDKLLKVDITNFRDYSDKKNNQVDDTPYGGGDGMVLMCDPIVKAIEEKKKKNTKVILMSPQGEKFTQKKAIELSKESHLIFVCGHYEGFDERIKNFVDEEISIGDYVLTGGELPAMILIDSISRLVPGVIDEGSYENDSFMDDLLDYPTYTKPREYRGMKVPDVLLSGDHKKIDEWRKEKQIENTKEKRPDLIKDKEKVVKEVGKYSLIDDKEEKSLISINIEDSYNFLPNNKVKKSDLASINKVMVVEPTFINSLAKANVEKKIKILMKQANIVLNDETDDEGAIYVLGELQRMQELLLSQYAKYLGMEYVSLMQIKLEAIKNGINAKLMAKMNIQNFETKRGRGR